MLLTMCWMLKVNAECWEWFCWLYAELVKNINAIQTIDTSNLVQKADYDVKIDDIEKKITVNDKYSIPFNDSWFAIRKLFFIDRESVILSKKKQKKQRIKPF